MIDTSQLNTFLQCPKKYYLKYIKCLAKIKYDDRDIDREWGKCVHKGLEHYYKGEKEKVMTAFMGFQEIEGQKVKTKDNGLKVLQEYISNYATQDKDWEILDVEINDTFMIHNIEYTVKIDLVVKDRNNIYCVDHKTSSSKSKFRFFSSFDPNMQVSAYCAYAEKKYGQCSGFIPNGIFVGHRERKWKGEPAGFHCSFQRTIVNRYPEQLRDFEKNVDAILYIMKQCRNSGSWIKNEEACTNYRGCEMKELCISCDDLEIQESLYSIVDPFEYLKKEV